MSTGAGDRVVGSVLFTDLVGFTAYADEMGDHAAVAALDEQRRIVDEALAARHGGRVVKELGDGLMIWFDEAVDGVDGARRIRAAFDDARDSFPLAVRMGIHRGEAIPRGDDVVGRVVNVAARVCDLAGPGELLASSDALASADGSVADPLGPVRVKGIGEPVWLHRLRPEPSVHRPTE